MARDDFSAPTKRLIAQRAGYVCSYPSCLAPTSGPRIDGDGAVNVGEAAHICAASPNGPRYDESMTPEERVNAENGIWMCGTHATLVDRDEERFTVEQLRTWKYDAEDRAMRMVGQQQGCAQGRLATVSPAIRLGPNQLAIINTTGEQVQCSEIFDPDDEQCKITWFVSGFVIQFMIQKRANLTNVVLQNLVTTVHETKPVPDFRVPMMAFPTETSLFYVEIEENNGTVPRDFVPTRYYTKSNDGEPEQQQYPNPIVFDDNIPSPVALRLNAKTRGMYLISISAKITSGDDRETLEIVTPQWVIFEQYGNDDMVG